MLLGMKRLMIIEKTTQKNGCTEFSYLSPFTVHPFLFSPKEPRQK